ncbi:MAG: ROK family protein [Hungatella sp.]|nr:ROK family protein [Hungatella sp.]
MLEKIVEPDGRLCKCGRRGCLETVASEKGIRQYVVEGLKSGRSSAVESMVFHQDYDEIDMDIIYRGCMLNDALCVEAVNKMAYYLGIALANVINLFNPEMIVLEGSLINYEALFIEKVRQTVRENVWKNSEVLILTNTSQSKSNTAAMGGCIHVIEEILNGEIEIKGSD